MFSALIRDEDGVQMVEYGLLVALIAVVCISAVRSLGGVVNLFFNIAGSI